MKDPIKKDLEMVVNSLVNEDTEGATKAFHNYLRAKTQSILMNEHVEQLDELSRDTLNKYAYFADQKRDQARGGVDYNEKTLQDQEASPEISANPENIARTKANLAKQKQDVANRSRGISRVDKKLGNPEGMSRLERQAYEARR